MNEKIQELAIKAKIQMVSEPRLTEFAELIIDMCAEEASEVGTFFACHKDEESKGVCYMVRDAILELKK